ncbi:MAG: glycosyltransferase family 9 protein [Chloroherpetonaceae bacterium]|nr:glycosyltransferase family 9 protein [Chloroherpetonaceae bacterium]
MVGLPDWRGVRRVLLIRLSSIGDVVHALPVSAALGEAFPHVELTWVVEEAAADVVVGNPYVREVVVVPRERWKRGRGSPRVWREYVDFLRGLRLRGFDVSVDLQGYAKTGLIAWASGARYRVGWGCLRELARVVSRPIPPRAGSRHRVEWFLDVVRALGVEPGEVRFPLHVPAEAMARAEGLLCGAGLSPGVRFAVVNPATGDRMRRWGVVPYAGVIGLLARRLGMPSVLIGSARDAGLCREVAAVACAGAWPAGVLRPVVLAGETGLKELAALLRMCAVQVCGDTGSAHIGAAVGCPTVAVYGPSDPGHAGPWGQMGNVVCGRAVCGAGCSLERQRCGFAVPVEAGGGRLSVARCLRELTPEAVVGKVEAVRGGSVQG